MNSSGGKSKKKTGDVETRGRPRVLERAREVLCPQDHNVKAKKGGGRREREWYLKKMKSYFEQNSPELQHRRHQLGG